MAAMVLTGTIGKPDIKPENEGAMKYISLLSSLSLMICMGVGPALAASFDCSKAATKSEKLICGDQTLSAADSELAKVYRQATEELPDPEGLKKEQLSWIKNERDACPDAPCMLKAHDARAAALGNKVQKLMQEALKEANEHFTFQGKPINPKALDDLLPIMADRLPGPVTVDLKGGSNRYFVDDIVSEKGLVRATLTEEGNKSFFQYQRLGVLANGMHVIQTCFNGGGSGVFCNLLLIRFQVDTEYTDGGILRSRLLMARVGQFSLGAGYNGSIKVQPHEISIGPGGSGFRENAKTEVISFK